MGIMETQETSSRGPNFDKVRARTRARVIAGASARAIAGAIAREKLRANARARVNTQKSLFKCFLKMEYSNIPNIFGAWDNSGKSSF
jgi:hypothetical protein